MKKRSISTFTQKTKQLTQKPVSDEVKSLRYQIFQLLKENGDLRRQLDDHREFPFDKLGLGTDFAPLKMDENNGMTKKQISQVEDALQDALMFKKNYLSEVADLVVSQMKYHTEEEGWMCHVTPSDVDIGFRYNLDIACSAGFSFGNEKIKYTARISKVDLKASNLDETMLAESLMTMSSKSTASSV